MRRRDRYDVVAVIAANGAKLEAERAIELARIARERAERERKEREEQIRRDLEWFAECQAEKERPAADVLPWRKGAV